MALCSGVCAKMLPSSHKNLSAFLNALYMDKDMGKTLEKCGWELYYSYSADDIFEGEMEFDWQSHHLNLEDPQNLKEYNL